VDEFNRGVYEYMIATDEAHMADMKQHGAQTRKQKSKHRKDQGYGVSRGIDFQGVENVLNFDFPPSPDAYIHRVGRTARGTETGSSLSFVCDSEVTQLKEVEAKLTGGAVNETPIAVKPYKFKMSEIDGFRYRVKDALKAVSKSAVREARLKEIKAEVLNSEKLKVYFEDNPRDLQVLRHDRTLQPKKVQPHLRQVPSYLMPAVLKASEERSKAPPSKRPKPSPRQSQAGWKKKSKKKSVDPLKAYMSSKS
jgi:ATP-dependent RNA helicase DDX56/DBP9